MKKTIILTIFASMLIFCTGEGDPDVALANKVDIPTTVDPNDPNSGPTVLPVSATTVSDANGTNLGNVVSVDTNEIILMSTTGYLYKVNWKGDVLTNAGRVYETSDCTGTGYLGSMNSNMYPRTVYYSSVFNKLFVSTLDSDGYPLVISSLLHIKPPAMLVC